MQLRMVGLIFCWAIFCTIDAGLASMTVAQDSSSGATLAQVTATTGGSSGATMGQIVQEFQPSTVLMAVEKDPETGLSFNIVTDFTPEKIDKYPEYKMAFANCALDGLESENPCDVQATAYLVDKYPELASYIEQGAQKTHTYVHNTVRKKLNRANRKPLLTGNDVVETINGAPLSIVRIPALLAVLQGVDAACGAFETQCCAKELVASSNVAERLGGRLLAIEAQKEWNVASTDLKKQLKELPGKVAQELPRNVMVGVGAAVITNQLLREFDERVGEPFEGPKYDSRPGANNVAYHSYNLAKGVIRNIALPLLLSHFVVGPAYDHLTQNGAARS